MDQLIPNLSKFAPQLPHSMMLRARIEADPSGDPLSRDPCLLNGLAGVDAVRVTIVVHEAAIDEHGPDTSAAGADAERIRDYMARWEDPNAYGISHAGWGLPERGLWHALSLYGNTATGLDGRVFEGNFLLSTGPNHAAGRRSRCHFDIPMRQCSIFLDGTPIAESVGGRGRR